MIYKDFECVKCEIYYEDFEVNDMEERPVCPKCKDLLDRVFTAVNFKLKGSGYHSTDYPTSGETYRPKEDRKLHLSYKDKKKLRTKKLRTKEDNSD